MLRIYLAAAFERQAETRQWRERLRELPNVEITSRWLDEQEPAGAVSGATTEDHARRCAEIDIEDVDRCDLLVAFCPEDGFRKGRGGCHVEFGYALAKGKALLVVGMRENVFHVLVPQIGEDRVLSVIGAVAEVWRDLTKDDRLERKPYMTHDLCLHLWRHSQ